MCMQDSNSCTASAPETREVNGEAGVQQEQAASIRSAGEGRRLKWDRRSTKAPEAAAAHLNCDQQRLWAHQALQGGQGFRQVMCLCTAENHIRFPERGVCMQATCCDCSCCRCSWTCQRLKLFMVSKTSINKLHAMKELQCALQRAGQRIAPRFAESSSWTFVATNVLLRPTSLATIAPASMN
jgi:hypothetical protein